LAVFALEGDRELGAGIKKTLRHYADWVRRTIEQDRGVFSMEGFPLCAFQFRELRRRKLMTPEDEPWARELLLSLRRYQCAWRPGDGLWRGSHHRSQCQGLNHALAAAFYPDEPGLAAAEIAELERCEVAILNSHQKTDPSPIQLRRRDRHRCPRSISSLRKWKRRGGLGHRRCDAFRWRGRHAERFHAANLREGQGKLTPVPVKVPTSLEFTL
jgi:hypothetical protein